ncbi:MAG: MFS transporter [Proteobacteria bacterium]|nr:MFS transporter [Pseudomonadota bacterium]
MSGNGLTLKTKISYGMGDVGFALTSVMLSMVLAVFLTDVAGIRPAYAAIVIFIGRTWDYINDPIIGFMADRTNTKWGRYRPYLFWSAVPFGVTFAFLWWVPPLGSEIALTVYYAAIYFVHEAATTFGLIPYIALTPTLSPVYDDRTSLTSFRMVFSIIGTLIAAVVPLAVIGVIDVSNQNTVLHVGMAMAAISAAPLFVTFWGTKEEVTIDQSNKPGLGESLKAAVQNKPLVFAILIYLLTITGLEVGTAVTLYFLRYSIHIAADADTFVGIMFAVAIVAIPAWNYVSRILDKAKTFIIGGAVMILTRIVFMFMAPETSVVYLYIITVIAGIGFAAIQTLPWAIIPDTVEYDEFVTGKRREGVFYSLMILLKSVAVSISLPLILVVMDYSGYVANVEIQTNSADNMIRFLFGGVPSIMFGGAMICAALYPLTRKKFEEIQAVLAERREKEQT